MKAWIHSPAVDGVFILGPSLAVTAALFAFPSLFSQQEGVPPWLWLLLIVGVDVTHVYTTLYRTYFDKVELAAHPLRYRLAPLIGWAAGVLLYRVDPLLFWRVLAYLAVFHFMRQQYGFFMIYRRADPPAPSWQLRLDKAVIYAATLYPLLYWHTHLPRHFDWFVAGDFLALPSWLEPPGKIIYLLLLATYAAKEIWRAKQGVAFNLPRNLLLLGTAGSWYAGIVLFNGDLAFTAANILAHGIPYMALVWIHGRSAASHSRETPRFIDRFFSQRLLPIYVGIPLALAWAEEALWDGMIWRDHPTLFRWFHALPKLADPAMLAWLVPLLALPQITHYLLDGFLWRRRAPEKASLAPVSAAA
ncbi:MAG: hypothetical protein J0L97_03410 [Alphaproteobacteria bacterium]|nr:hypothetical protein [Alphaproteobacteria bacterium]